MKNKRLRRKGLQGKPARFHLRQQPINTRTIYHNAGLGGYGGSGYTDSVLMRDADLTNAWSGAADGTLEDRQYYSNNWRGDVVAILDDTGRMIEQVRYTPYGVPFALPAGDSDSDGDWDATDYAAIGGTYDLREDADLDGATDFFDVTHALNRGGSNYQTLGWKVLSSAYCANRKGYASYEHDAAAPATLAHVRYRVYNFTLGRWIQRDPAGYTDGPNLYGYVGARAIASKDPRGLAALVVGTGGGTGGGCSEKTQGGCGGGGSGSGGGNNPPAPNPPPAINPSKEPFYKSTSDFWSCFSCCGQVGSNFPDTTCM